jgi:hypothetical protein
MQFIQVNMTPSKYTPKKVTVVWFLKSNIPHSENREKYE